MIEYLMEWWAESPATLLGVLAGVFGALAAAYWFHKRHSRDLAAALKPLAVKYEGALIPATQLVLPQLRFERDGRRYLATAMATSGTGNPDSGPFSLAILELPQDTERKFTIAQRGRKRDAHRAAAFTGDAAAIQEAFDAAFKITGPDSDAAARLFDTHDRQTLLKSQLPQLKLRVDGPKIDVHMDGYATSVVEIEELIGLADMLADRCAAGT